VNIIGPFLER